MHGNMVVQKTAPCQKAQGSGVVNKENEIDRKPGSVLNDDLSRLAIASKLKPL